jgi:hypothetical protein
MKDYTNVFGADLLTQYNPFGQNIFFDTGDDFVPATETKEPPSKPPEKDDGKTDAAYQSERMTELESMTTKALSDKVVRLETDNKNYRSQLQGLNEAQKQLAAYQAVGKLSEVQAAIAERDELRGKVKGIELEALNTKVADLMGWNGKTLNEIALQYALNLEVVPVPTVQTNSKGEKVTVHTETAFVVEGEGKAAKRTALSEYFESHSFLKLLLPALSVEPKENGKKPPVLPQKSSDRTPHESTKGSVSSKVLSGFKPKKPT